MFSNSNASSPNKIFNDIYCCWSKNKHQVYPLDAVQQQQEHDQLDRYWKQNQQQQQQQQQQSLHHGIKNKQKRQVSFNSSVDIRLSIVPDYQDNNNWYTADEVKEMKQVALQRNVGPLRHSENITSSFDPDILLSSPPPSSMDGDNNNTQQQQAKHLPPRVHSTSANLCNLRGSCVFDDIRYQAYIPSIDKEVYLSNEERRYCARRRLHHSCKVLAELDRQYYDGYSRINALELASVSKMVSSGAYMEALERGRSDATLAHAALLENRANLT